MNQKDFQYINLSYLEMITDGDQEMKKEILGIVLEEVAKDLPMLSTFHSSENWEQLHHVSHKFKSTLAYVGNDTLTDTNRQVEHITKFQHDFEKLPDLLKIIDELQPRVHNELQLAFNAL